MKDVIKINNVWIMKVDESEITTEFMDNIISQITKLVEENGCIFTGTFELGKTKDLL